MTEKQISKQDIRAGKYNPRLVIRKGRPVCSECGTEPQPDGGFGNGRFHWTCCCVLVQEEW